METVVIEDHCVHTKRVVRHVQALPFAAVETEKKKSFEEVVTECNGRPASEFFDELRYQIKEHFKNT